MLHISCLIILIPIVIVNSLLEGKFPSLDTIKIAMPEVRPTKKDHYLCTAINISSYGTQFIYKFQPHANAGTAHHMILNACGHMDPELVGKQWDCGTDEAKSCKNRRILYAWAKNAEPTVLPKDVGFRIGPESNIRNLLLQVHYAYPLPEGTKDKSGFELRVTRDEPTFLAGMLTLFKNSLNIPAYTEKIHGDINCPLPTPVPIHPFAYRVHAHKLAVVISAYKLDQEGRFEEIGRRNPQWPQGFFPTTNNLTIYGSDFLVARCTYSTINFARDTQLGGTADDEMCNFYLMYYTKSRDPHDHSLSCGDEFLHQISAHLPNDSDMPLPRNKTLEEYANGDKTLQESRKKSVWEFFIVIFPVLVILGLVIRVLVTIGPFGNKNGYTLQSNADMEKLIIDEDESEIEKEKVCYPK